MQSGQSMQEWWQAIRRTATPIIVIESHDEIATARQVRLWASEEKVQGENVPTPLWEWTCSGGYVARGAVCEESSLEGIEQIEDALIEVGKEGRIPLRSVLLYHWRTEFWQSPMCRQALIDLREVFKRVRQCAVIIVPYGSDIPGDVLVHCVTYREELPGREELQGIAQRVQKSARGVDTSIPLLEGEAEQQTIAALRGMSAYQAEQQAYMSVEKGRGIVVDKVYQSKIDMINGTPGLQVWSGGETFSEIAGNEGAKGYFRRIIAGRLPIRLVIWVDESEDMLAGVEGDLSGIAQAYLGRLAGHIEDTKAQCVLAYGHPGTGKSLTAKAVASEAGCLCIALDLGTMKGSLVGQSEAQLARALAMERAIVGGERGSTLWVWTTNNADKLPPKLRSRMQAELFYDSPREQERLAIWALYRSKYELAVQDYPDDSGWTGREIERCCRLAWQMGVSIKEASGFIVARAIVDAREIEERRRKASGRYLSAGEGGVYRYQVQEKEERGIEL